MKVRCTARYYSAATSRLFGSSLLQKGTGLCSFGYFLFNFMESETAGTSSQQVSSTTNNIMTHSLHSLQEHCITLLFEPDHNVII